MTRNDAIVAAYRVLQRLYPRAFREEYGDDIVQLFREQLRDESSWRVCGRGLVDFAVSLPTRHVEIRMARNRTPALVMLVSLVLAATTFAFVEGLVGVAVAALGAALAIIIWRKERPARAERGAAGRWWKLLTSGIALLAIVLGATTAMGELSEPEWVVFAVALLVSVTLIGTGTVLGVIHLTDRHRANRIAA